MRRILFDGKAIDVLAAESLPMLIHGKEGSGASLYTIVLASKWCLKGYNILFLCGYPMAEKEFANEVNGAYPKVTFYTQEKVNEFKEAVSKSDLNETVIVVKNIELFDKSIFELINSKSDVVISGDIEKSEFKNRLLDKKFATEIYFSSLSRKNLPELKKFHGYVISDEYRSITYLQ